MFKNFREKYREIDSIIELITNPDPEQSLKRSRMIIRAFGWVLYVAGVLMALSHVFNLVGLGVAPEFRWLAYASAGLIGFNALALPYALHVWAVDGWHKGTAIIFYIADLIALLVNTWADWNYVRGSNEELVKSYLDGAAPFTFLLVLITWAALIALDPERRNETRRFKRTQAHDLAVEDANHKLIMAELAVELAEMYDKTAQTLADAGLTAESLGLDLSKSRLGQIVDRVISGPDKKPMLAGENGHSKKHPAGE